MKQFCTSPEEMGAAIEEPILTLRNLHIQFPGEQKPLSAVSGIDVSIPQGGIVGLVGESGCGKSLTALSILGLIPPPGAVTEGEILFEGQNLKRLSERALRHIRGNRIAMIFQDPMTSLNPVYSVGRQVAEVLRLHKKYSRTAAKKRTIELFGEVGIPDPDRRFDAYPRELSGGLRQRVMIAMAMACEPQLLIADEPTTALDVTIQAQILRLVERLRRERGASVLLITHNMGVVAQLCDEVSVMYAGQIVEQAETKALFQAPLHPYTQGLLAAIPSTEGTAERLRTIPGTVPDLNEMPQGCRFYPRCSKRQDSCQETVPPLLEVDSGHFVRCPVAVLRREGEQYDIHSCREQGGE